MPTISVAKVTHRYNLGNYEFLEVGLEAFVAEGENIDNVLSGLEGAISTYVQTRHPEALKTSNVSKPQAQPQPQVQTPQPTKMVQLTIQEQLERIKQPFGDLAGLLNFTVKNGKLVITPRTFLGAENFSKVANVVRGLQGQYISEGKTAGSSCRCRPSKIVRAKPWKTCLNAHCVVPKQPKFSRATTHS